MQTLEGIVFLCSVMCLWGVSHLDKRCYKKISMQCMYGSVSVEGF